MKAVGIMILVQILFVGVNVLYKLADNDGMSLRIIVAYRFVFATAFVAPIAFIVERKTRPKLTWMVVLLAFFCGLFGGAMGQNLYLTSLSLTSMTYTSAMSNLLPAITLILAVSLRMEKLGLSSLAGKAKVLGTLTGIGGAMILTFYKGINVNILSTNINLLHHNNPNQNQHYRESSGSHHIIGSFLAAVSCVCYSFYLIIQTKLTEIYPCPYSSTALMCLMASIQGLVFAICTERDWNQWNLGCNIRLLTVAYAGIAGSGVCYTLIALCAKLRGPLFVSVFNPLMVVLVALAGTLVLNEKLHLGSIIGAVLIVLGLYIVLWGKNREIKKMSQLVPAQCSLELRPPSIELVVTSPPGSGIDTNAQQHISKSNKSSGCPEQEAINFSTLEGEERKTDEAK